jgi:N4-gp56 family major capsid protein
MSQVNYGDISPRTAAYVVRELLKRGMPVLVFEKFGQSKPLPKNSTKTVSFRRYFLKDASMSTFTPAAYFSTDNFDQSKKQLTEGVTPSATALDKQDLTATLTQYGDRVEISDVVMDTHEDPVLQEAIEVLGEQAPIILESARFNVLKAGTNVIYTNSDSARTDVDTVLALKDLRQAERSLERQLARPLMSMVRSTPSYGTEAILPAFVGVCHTDLRYNLEILTGFTSPKDYGNISPWDNEIGAIGKIRFVASTLVEPWRGGGAADSGAVLNTGGITDVYPILIFAKDAYGLVPLKGKASITPMIVNAKPSDSDPLAQRNHASWKAMQTTIILNDSWMIRIECAISDDDALSA